MAGSEWLLVSGCQWDIYLSMRVAELGNECARHGVGHLDLCAGLECDGHLASQLHSQSCQILQPVTPPLRAILGIRHVLCSSHSHTLIVVGEREGKVKLFNYPVQLPRWASAAREYTGHSTCKKTLLDKLG